MNKNRESRPFARIYEELLADNWMEHQITGAIEIMRKTSSKSLSTTSVRIWLMENTLRHREGQGVIKSPAAAPTMTAQPSKADEGQLLREKAQAAVAKAVAGWAQHYCENREHYEKQKRLERRFRRSNG